jgi:GcrA cell cycle regulator
MVASIWTEWMVKRMKELHAAGYSASQIAAELGGVSRNAVIGKLHRSGIRRDRPDFDRPKKERTARAPRPKDKPLQTADREFKLVRSEYRFSHFGYMQSVEIRELTDIPPEQIEAPLIKLMDLRSHHCRWPIGEPSAPNFGFCGMHKFNGSSYCAKHWRIAFRRR